MRIQFRDMKDGTFLVNLNDKETILESLDSLTAAKDSINCILELFSRNGLELTEDELIEELSSGNYRVKEKTLPIMVDSSAKKWIDSAIGNAKDIEDHKRCSRLYAKYFNNRSTIPQSIRDLVSLYGQQLFSKIAIDGYIVMEEQYYVLDEVTNQYLSKLPLGFKWVEKWDTTNCLLSEEEIPKSVKHLARRYKNEAFT